MFSTKCQFHPYYIFLISMLKRIHLFPLRTKNQGNMTVLLPYFSLMICLNCTTLRLYNLAWLDWIAQLHNLTGRRGLQSYWILSTFLLAHLTRSPAPGKLKCTSDTTTCWDSFVHVSNRDKPLLLYLSLHFSILQHKFWNYWYLVRTTFTDCEHLVMYICSKASLYILNIYFRLTLFTDRMNKAQERFTDFTLN